MILDLGKFLARERPHWEALAEMLDRLESNQPLTLEDARRLHALYERASADLAQLATFAAEPATRRHLESLVARAYAEIHEVRQPAARFNPWFWFTREFPSAFRRHLAAFGVSLAISFLGVVFGTAATLTDPESRHVTMPFGHADLRPSERVRRDESPSTPNPIHSAHASFSGQLMTHNTRVSIGVLSFGMTWGIGTLVLLFYNGVSLGAIGTDYILDGQSRFLFGWILPHGSIELPAIFIAGQAGLVLAHALIGRHSNLPLASRLRAVGPDLVTLICGVAVLLVYAGVIEAFLSQYHEPVIPYGLKIAFGIAELAVLTLFLARAGRPASSPAP
jgi:uncharacterized membrane protein SpoIIM required for sporulation